MGGGGGILSSIVRTATAVGTAGVSELSRAKPFQPGGKTDPLDIAAAATGGVLGGVGGGATLAGVKAVGSPKPPPLDTSAQDLEKQVAQRAKDAANAVQTADAEGRRARSAKRQSSVLGSYQPGQAVNAATLQPAQPRRSVLG